LVVCLILAFGVTGLFAIPFMPETQYNRDVSTRIIVAESGGAKESEVTHIESQGNVEPKKSFVTEMKFADPTYRGTERFWVNFSKPFPMLVSPIIIYVFFINAFNTIWYMTLAYLSDRTPGQSSSAPR
jgi:hypothetical protein